MRPTFLAVLLLAALAPAVGAQTLRHVRCDDANARELAGALMRRGLDVVEGSESDASFELVLSVPELRSLREEGLELTLLARGRPYREIQAEQAAEGVPAGYPDLAGVLAQMNTVAAAHPSIARVVDLTATYGTPPTFEGRHVFAMQVSDNVGQDEDEAAVLLVSAHHCREIVTPWIALEAIERLTSGYGSNPAITQLVDEREIWIAPVWNPDGYEHVFAVDNLWRKNRRVFGADVGVDLNRNYPFGWSSSCAGSTSPASPTYKGPGPTSEAETQTMLALHADRHFAAVADFHSSGLHVRYGYGCDPHPWTSFFQTEASVLSGASGYGGTTQPSCCLGGQFHTPLATMGSFAFLWETASAFQPTFAQAQAEADQVWPGFLALLQRPIPLSGHVTDASTDTPLVADVSYPGVAFLNGESNQSEPRFGRYHSYLPPGTHDVLFTAPGHEPLLHTLTVTATSRSVLQVALEPTTVTYCTGKTSSLGCVPYLDFSGIPSASSSEPFAIRGNDLLPGQAGLVLYGVSGRGSLPFHNGTLCVKAPLVRFLPPKAAKSTGSQPCSGLLRRDFNARIQSGADPVLVPGQQVQAQVLQRDPALGDGFGDTLTDGIEFVIEP